MLDTACMTKLINQDDTEILPSPGNNMSGGSGGKKKSGVKIVYPPVG